MTDKKLGRLPAKSDPRALQLARLAPKLATTPPLQTNFWTHRSSFALRSYGNLQYGDCTRAKQAIASMRMERLETHTKPTIIEDEEVIRAYREMSDRLYGGGDNGAYETDALDCWRRPEYTFKNVRGRALTIDAYLRVNHTDQIEMRSAMAAAGSHGIAICINLPAAFQSIEPPNDWDIPIGQQMTGDWVPGSWGGHSMWARDYDEVGIYLVHTWEIPDQRITWRAAAAYLDEAHVIIDSLDYWRTHKPEAAAVIDLLAVKSAVNSVSSKKIA